MKSIKRVSALASSALLGISSVMALGFGGVAHAASATEYKWTGASSATAGQNGCTTNCWSVAGNWDVSTDGGVTWTTATSAPASTDNGGAGDNLVFDDSALSANVAMTNDITNLTVGNISTLTGTNSYVYSIGGSAFTVTGGVAGSAGQSVSISSGVTFAGDQTFGNSNGAAVQLNGAVTIASGTLTANGNIYTPSLNIASGAHLVVNNYGQSGALSGSGSIVIATPTGTNANYSNTYYLSDTGTPSTFTGTIDIQKGGTLNPSGNNPANALGSATITVENGGQINVSVNPTAPSSTATITLPNNITMGGNGAGVDQMSQGAIIAGLYDSSKNEEAGTLTVNLSGAVTLTANTQLASTYATATTYDFTGSLNQNGHTLGFVTAAQPTYGQTTVQVKGKTVASATVAPKTPDTGFALSSSHPATILGATAVMAGIIIVLANVSTRKLASAHAKAHRR